MTDKNPVQYAEDELGVHEVYEQAQEAHGQLSTALDLYAACAQGIRLLNEQIDAREFEIASDYRAKDHSMSQSALERAVKDARQTDDRLKELRHSLRATQNEQENAHADIERAKYRLRVLSARMNELGGLLAFFGAAKAASARPKS